MPVGAHPTRWFCDEPGLSSTIGLPGTEFNSAWFAKPAPARDARPEPGRWPPSPTPDPRAGTVRSEGELPISGVLDILLHTLVPSPFCLETRLPANRIMATAAISTTRMTAAKVGLFFMVTINAEMQKHATIVYNSSTTN